MANKNRSLEDNHFQVAVVVLDSYSDNFGPFSTIGPECLLPVMGGKTLLDYNIEYLVDNNINEIYLFCTNHHNQIKDYLTTRKWKNVDIHFLYNIKCQSLGDVIRDIDTKGLITSNFILVTATGIISNVCLKPLTIKFNNNNDKNKIMTAVCCDVEKDLNISYFTNNCGNVNVLFNNNNRIVYYNKLTSRGKNIEIPAAVLLAGLADKANLSNTLQHKFNLLDSQIYLCSSHVLHIFSDNFDFETMYDFICGIVDENIMGNSVYVEIIKRKFGSHMSIIYDLNSYYFEIMRLLCRIDLVLSLTELSLFHRPPDKLNIYIHKDSLKSTLNLNVNRNVYMGSGCEIKDNVNLINCYIGSNVKIGKNVYISNSIVLNNTIICDNNNLNAVMIGLNVKVGLNCNICENVVFSNNCMVKNFSQIVTPEIFFSDIKENEETNLNIENLLIKGFQIDRYKPYKFQAVQSTDDSDSVFSDDDNVCSTSSKFLAGGDNICFVNPATTHYVDFKLTGTTNSFSSTDDQQSTSEDYDDNTDLINFLNGIIDVLTHGLKNDIIADDIILEINGCKHAYFIEIEDFCLYLAKAIFRIPIILTDNPKFNYLDDVKVYSKRLLPVIENYFTKTSQSQMLFLDSLLNFVLTEKLEVNGKGVNLVDNIFVKMLHYFFNELAFLHEEIIIKWFTRQKDILISRNDENAIQTKQALHKLDNFILWLQEDNNDE